MKTRAEVLFSELHEPLVLDRHIPTLDDWSAAIAALKAKDNPAINAKGVLSPTGYWHHSNVSHAKLDTAGGVLADISDAAQPVTFGKPVIRLCRDCRFVDGTSCLCPKQSRYADKINERDLTPANSIRQRECRGRWWIQKA